MELIKRLQEKLNSKGTKPWKEQTVKEKNKQFNDFYL